MAFRLQACESDRPRAHRNARETVTVRRAKATLATVPHFAGQRSYERRGIHSARHASDRRDRTEMEARTTAMSRRRPGWHKPRDGDRGRAGPRHRGIGNAQLASRGRDGPCGEQCGHQGLCKHKTTLCPQRRRGTALSAPATASTEQVRLCHADGVVAYDSRSEAK